MTVMSLKTVQIPNTYEAEKNPQSIPLFLVFICVVDKFLTKTQALGNFLVMCKPDRTKLVQRTLAVYVVNFKESLILCLNTPGNGVGIF